MNNKEKLKKFIAEAIEGYDAEDAFNALCDVLLMKKAKKQIDYAREADRRRKEDFEKIEDWKKDDQVYCVDDFPPFVKNDVLKSTGLPIEDIVFDLYTKLFREENTLFFAEHDGTVYFNTQGYVNIVKGYSSEWLDIEDRERWYCECGLFTITRNIRALL